MRLTVFVAVALLATAYSAQLLAQAASTSVAPNQSLSEITSETVLLKAKAAEADANRAAAGDVLGQPAAPSMPGFPAPTMRTFDESPRVLGVFGSGHALYARLTMVDGSHVDARSGEVLPGGEWRVEISGERVRLVPLKAGSH